MPTLKTHGITQHTLGNMLLNAGTLYKNLEYDTDSNTWTGDVLGATSGGIKFTYTAQYLDVAVDGATVLVKGISKQKVGEEATLEGQMTEFTKDTLKTAMHLVEAETSDVTGYTKLVTKSNLDTDDYLENVAYVGTKSNGEQVIIILPNAICLEAFEVETKNAEQATFAFKMQSTADFANDTLDKLDVVIYYPEANSGRGE